MIRDLLVRGMLVGILAGLLSFGFARVFGEPQVDLAIAFEGAAHHHDHAAESAAPAAEADEPELVSRSVQAGLGLFTGVVLYSAAFGGLFALAFAIAWGRVGALDARSLAALLTVLGFVVLVLVPALKYPANPPAVGDPETIGMRTALFWTMLLGSLCAAFASAALRAALLNSLGAWNATLVAGVAFVVLATGLMALLPAVNEVPEEFPASLLWRFRLASFGTQAVMWATIGIVFGALTHRSLARAR
jgi:predicted cobalt transporter CbtA